MNYNKIAATIGLILTFGITVSANAESEQSSEIPAYSILLTAKEAVEKAKEEALKKKEQEKKKQQEDAEKLERIRKAAEEERKLKKQREEAKKAEQEKLKKIRQAAEEAKKAEQAQKAEEEKLRKAREQKLRQEKLKAAKNKKKKKRIEAKARKWMKRYNKEAQYAETQKRFFQSTQFAKWKSIYMGGHISRASLDGEAGVTAGGFVGRSWQKGTFVYGVEADISISSDVENRKPVGNAILSARSDWMASIRAKGGYLIDSKTALFGTIGIAFADFDMELRGEGGNARSSDTLTGLIIGAGVEHRFNQNWSARVDYTYTAFGEQNIKNAVRTASFDPDIHAFRVAFVYNF